VCSKSAFSQAPFIPRVTAGHEFYGDASATKLRTGRCRHRFELTAINPWPRWGPHRGSTLGP
jgi:hypothetical protein